MTVIHFKTESDNETLQENIRSIVQTVSRALTPQTRIVYAPAQLSGSNGTSGEQAQATADFVEAVDDDLELSTSSKKSKNSSRPQPRTPQLLDDLDLSSATVTLKAFMEEKHPAGDTKRYLAIAYWLKTYLNINEITMDHVYTCYRSLGWNVPNDAGVALRNAKSNGWMKKGAGKGAYALNHIGEGVVNDMA
jgi:hypothetical protein